MKCVRLSLMIGMCFVSTIFAMESNKQTPREILSQADASLKEAQDILNKKEDFIKLANFNLTRHFAGVDLRQSRIAAEEFSREIETHRRYSHSENIKALDKIDTSILLAQAVTHNKAVTTDIQKDAQNILDKAERIKQTIVCMINMVSEDV